MLFCVCIKRIQRIGSSTNIDISMLVSVHELRIHLPTSHWLNEGKNENAFKVGFARNVRRKRSEFSILFFFAHTSFLFSSEPFSLTSPDHLWGALPSATIDFTSAYRAFYSGVVKTRASKLRTERKYTHRKKNCLSRRKYVVL